MHGLVNSNDAVNIFQNFKLHTDDAAQEAVVGILPSECAKELQIKAFNLMVRNELRFNQ